MEKKLVLEVKNLVTEFQTEDEVVRAVNDISFTLCKGETIGIVGESGSGKSVTALSVMRLISHPGKISSGQILFHSEHRGGVDLLDISEQEMRKYRGNELAMIFQEPMTSLNPVYTCGDQVMEAIILHQKISAEQAREKTIELFKEAHLPRPEIMFDTYPHQISGGQKQRVMIAMAMSCQPSVLIADEPTTALDVTVQKRILDLMRDLQFKHEMGIIFITHDLGVIAELADRVVVMFKGKIVEHGSVWSIFYNPQHPYTKGLLACRPPLNKRLYLLPTITDFMKIDEATGQMKESNKSVSSVIDKFVVSDEERDSRHKLLYSREPLLKIHDMKTYFPIKKGLFGKIKGYVKAVDGVTFDVYSGETLGLVGESGCGKTTLGRSILRLIEPTEGEIIYKGRSINSLQSKKLRAIRKHIQIIFQDPYSSLNPRSTIGEAIMEPMRVHKIFENDKQRKDKVMELLSLVNLNELHFYRHPHEFSGGQRQRICIARALALNPEFIICDESVSALDVSVQAQVLNLLNQLRNQCNFTYIFISHDLSVVKFMSDRMMVMQHGRIIEIGDADQIYRNPQTQYTQKLISAIPKGQLEDIKRAIEEKKTLRAGLQEKAGNII